MAVNVGQRNVPDTPANRQLDACLKARELAEHTIRCCGNRKIFLPEYDGGITNDLLALLSLAHSLFHLKNKRVAYWAKMTIETRGLIRKWHEADVKRYGNL